MIGDLMTDFPLAVCAEMVFVDRPMTERVRLLSRAGFMVEIWDWTKHDIDALAQSGATFSSMTGYVRGTLSDEEGAVELIQTARESISIAKRLNVPRLNLHGTGLDRDGRPVKPTCLVTGDMFARAISTLRTLAELGAEHDVTFLLENLNTAVDHPGTPFARAEDCLALVASVDHPNLKLMLDLYHAQIGEGNLIELTRRCLPWIGEIQVADVPGRHEPGTGEINYVRVAHSLRAMGYDGPIGLEAWPKGDDNLALERFRETFAP